MQGLKQRTKLATKSDLDVFYRYVLRRYVSGDHEKAAEIALSAYDRGYPMGRLMDVIKTTQTVKNDFHDVRPGKIFSVNRGREIEEEHLTTWLMTQVDQVEGEVFVLRPGRVFACTKLMTADGLAWLLSCRHDGKAISSYQTGDPLMALAEFYEMKRLLGCQ